MTGILTTSLVASSLGGLLKERGGSILQNPPLPPLRSAPKPAPAPIQPSLLGKVSATWFQISSLVRFFVSGNLGNVCFFFIERGVFQYLMSVENLPEYIEIYKETFSFFLGYVLQIGVQHLLHAFLVYGLETINTREKYLKTLLGQFYAYGIALFGSTFLNLLLITNGVDKTVAFFFTMIIFACINYYLIGWLVKRAVRSSQDPEPEHLLKGRKAIQQKGGLAKDMAGKKADNKIKSIRRGGAFDVQELYHAFLPHPSFVHQMVLEMGPSIDVNKVNDLNQQ